MPDSFVLKERPLGGLFLAEQPEASSLPLDEQRQRHIIFFTDGAVSTEEEVLERVREMEQQGEDIIYLEVGETDFDVLPQ